MAKFELTITYKDVQNSNAFHTKTVFRAHGLNAATEEAIAISRDGFIIKKPALSVIPAHRVLRVDVKEVEK